MEFIQKFKDFLLLQKPAPSKATVKNYAVDVKHFISWLEDTKQIPFDPTIVTLELIHLFKSEKEKTLSSRSLDRHISSLRKFFQSLKMQGFVSRSPFEQTAADEKRATNDDPYHLKGFKDFLYVYNASNLTIKNYIIDVKQFIRWAEEVTKEQANGNSSENNALSHFGAQLVNDYRDRLLDSGTFSPASINRKLSSLRKYLLWADSQNLLGGKKDFQDNLNSIENINSTSHEILPEKNINEYQNESEPANRMPQEAQPSMEKQKRYSSFPIFRLIQKISVGTSWLIDGLLVAPLAQAAIAGHRILWIIKGKPLFTKNISRQGASSKTSQFLGLGLAFQPRIANLKKSLFMPHALSIAHLPWYKKAFYHAKYTRPNWYKRYHNLALAHYFNWAILMIFCAIIGYGMYATFVQKPASESPVAAAAPPRILSFQGRLTDTSDTAITSATNLRFAIYSDLAATGSALLWQEVDSVTPDANGVFSVLLGKGTTIPQSLFANNTNLYLGITVGQTPELTPRQQLATVAYATNAETLQGLPPITNAGGATTNVVLALDGSGNLTIGGSAAPVFTASGGNFTLSGQTVTLTTVAGSNTNVVITPDGKGLIDLQKPLENSTLNNNIPSAAGAVEVDDAFAVLATSSGQSAVTINQDGSGPIISASAGGAQRFTLSNSGSITAPAYANAGGVIYTDGAGLFLQTSSGTSSQCLTGGATPSWTSCSSAAGANFWTLNSTDGTLYPINTTLDVFFGGTSSSSAKFAFINNAGGIPTASISGNLTLNAAGVIQTTNNQALTIGGNSTGNIILSPLNGSGNVTVSGLSTGIVHSSSIGVLSSSPVLLGSEVSGQLPIANGGTNSTAVPTLGGVAYGTGTAYAFSGVGLPGQCLTSTGGGAPNWTTCATTSGTNFWTLDSANGTLYPINTTLDVFFGGTSSSSAKFAFINNAGGTPTASISGNLTLNAAGVIQTTNNQALTLGGNATGAIVFGSNVGSNILPRTTDTYDLGSASLEWNNLYVKNIISTGSLSGFWQRNSGVLAPLAITDDLSIGGAATSTAKFQVFGNTGNATTTGTLTFTGGGSQIQTTSNQPLTIGGNATGNIILSPNNGSGSVTISSLSTGVVHSSSIGVLSSSPVLLGSEVSGTLPIANGGTNTTTIGSAGRVVYSNGTSYAFTAVGGTGDCLVSNGTGTPSWSSCSAAAGGTNFWTLDGGSGVIYPINTTLDVLFGGTSSSSAKFAFINNAGGTPTASISGNLTLNAVGAIQTTNNQALTIGGNSTGNITLSPLNGSGSVTVNGTSLNTTASTFNLLNTTATTINFGSAATTLNIANNLLTTNIAIGGALGTTTVNNALNVNGVLTGTSDVVLGGSSANTINAKGEFISSLIPATTDLYDLGSTSLEWNNLYVKNIISGGTVAGFWQRLLGVLSPANITDDLAIGGSATASAKFQVFGNTGNATTTGNLTFNGNGTIQTTNNLPLTLGGNSTGNIILSPNNGSGKVTISSLSTGVVHSSSIGVLSSSNVLLGSEVSGTLPIANGGTNSTAVPTLGGVAYGTGTAYAFSGVGLTGQCLTSTGGGAPTWTACSTAAGSSNFWTLDSANGVLYPINTTLDVLFGGTSSSSANFAFINNAAGIPTASISGNLTLNAAGVIQTTKNQPLTLGGNSTGNIILKPNNGTGTVNINAPSLATDQTTFNLLNTTATTINFGSAATTLNIANNALTTNIAIGGAAGTTTVNNNLNVNGILTGTSDVVLGGSSANTINAKGEFISSLIPATTDLYDLGSTSLEWNNLYVKNIISGGTVAGFWQRLLGVLSPANITDDLAIGGSATASAKFQVFGNTGNATTTGTLTFTGIGSQIQTTSNQPLTIGGNATGNIILSPNNGTAGTVTINGAATIANNVTLTSGDLLTGSTTRLTNAGVGTFASGTQITNGGPSYLQIADTGGSGGFYRLYVGLNSVSDFGITDSSANSFIYIAGPNQASLYRNGIGLGEGFTSPKAVVHISGGNHGGNAALIVDQTGAATNDIFTASASGVTKFTVQNDGTLTAKKYTVQNGILYLSDTAGTIAETAQGAVHTFLRGNGASAPSFVAIDLTADVGTSILPIANGGTNSTAAPTAGGIAYGTGTAYAFTLAGTTGDCLTSTGAGTPLWQPCSSVGSSNFWTLNSANGVLYPINTTLDVLFGGTSSSSANFAFINDAPGSGVPTASISGNLTLNAAGVIQTTKNQPLTIGGNSTGNIILKPNNGSGTVNINAPSLATDQTTFNLLNTTATTINFGSAATTLNIANNLLTTNIAIGGALGTTTVNNALNVNGVLTGTSDVVLGGSSANTIDAKGQFISSLIPATTDLYDLGSPTLEWNNVYAKDIFASGTVAGFWQRLLGVLSPANITDDLAIGGSATASAKFQIFGNTGNATTAGNLTFNGNGVIQTTNNQPLTLGGDSTGAIVFGSNVGSNILPRTTNTYDLGSAALQWNNVYANNLLLPATGGIGGYWQLNAGALSPTNITNDVLIGGTSTASAKFQIFGNTGNATTTGNLTFNGNGVIQTTNNQSLTLGGNSTGAIVFGSNIGSDLLPRTTNSYDLGSSSLRWRNLFLAGDSTIAGNETVTGTVTAGNLILASTAQYGGFWQRNSGVLSPTNITDDLSIGGTATSSAKFQIFGNTGNATTAGNLTFNGNGVIQTTNNQPLTLGGNSTGAIVFGSNVGSNLLPRTTDMYDLGSLALEWNNIYAANVYSNGQIISNLWQENLGVLSPKNITDDLAIGGTATSSAKFQIFGLTGNATTAGTLTFNSPTGSIIETTNMYPLTIGSATTGSIQLSPKGTTGLFVTGTGSVGIGTTSPTAVLDVNGAASISSTLTFHTGSATIQAASNNTLTLGGNTTGAIAFGSNIDSNIIPAVTNTYDLGSLALRWNNVYANNLLLPATGGIGGYWQLNSGALSPTNITNDLLIGSTASSAARFHAYAFGGTVPAASASAKTSYAAFVVNNDGVGDVLAASSSSIPVFSIRANGQLVANQYNTAGGVFYTNASGVFTQASNASANTVLHGGATPTFSAVDLGSADVTGILTVGKGGLGADVTPAGAGEILYSSSATTYGHLAAAVSTGLCLTSNAAAAPSWTSCSSASSNFWTLSQGALFPINATLDLLVGGSATTSAKFAVINMSGSGTPTASVSSGLSGAGTYITANGTIQTTTNQGLTIGGDTTGNITLKPLNGYAAGGKVTIFGMGTGVVHSTLGVLSSSAIDLANTTTEVTGILGVGSGGTGQTSFTNGSLIYGAGTTTALNSLTIGAVNTILTSTGTAPQWSTNLIIPGNLTVSGNVIASLIPSATSVNLGSPTNYYGTVYANNFISPVGGGTSGFWQLTSNVLSPVNAWNDLAVGGNATGSATPWQVFATTVGVNTAGTATSSAGLSFRGTTTNVDLLDGSVLKLNTSVGGDSGLTTQLTLSNNGDLTLNGSNIITTQATVNLFNTTATAVNICNGSGCGANIGNITGASTIHGNVTLSDVSHTITVNGTFVSDLVPNVTNINSLGTNSLRWKNLFLAGDSTIAGNETVTGTVTAGNLILASTAQYGGFWQRNSGVLSPTNITDDLSIGGTATSSAKFQVFGNTGNATTAGTLIFTGATPIIQTTSMLPLTIGSASTGPIQLSPKGTTGLYIDGSGNVGINTISPTAVLDVAGAASVSSTLTFRTGSATIQATANNLLTLGGNTTGAIAFGSNINSSIIPTATDSFNLGSDPTTGGKEWDTLYVRQIVTPSTGGIAGFWQLSSGGVLAPANTTNDLAIGGNATASATFQVFGRAYTNDLGTVPAGTATTSGNFTFRGTPGSQTAFQTNVLNGASLGFYTSPGGDKGITTSNPSLFIAASGKVGIGTTNPVPSAYANIGTARLELADTNGNNSDFLQRVAGGSFAVHYFASSNGTLTSPSAATAGTLGQISFVGFGTTDYQSAAAILGRADGTFTDTSSPGYITFETTPAGSNSRTERLRITSTGGVGIGTSTIGNGALVVNQPNTYGAGDIFSASSSATPKFTINSNGYVGIGPSLTTAQGILDVASQGPLFPSDLTLGQAQGANLVTNPSFENVSSAFTNWTLSATAQLTKNDSATESALFGANSLKYYNVTPAGTYTATSTCIAVTASSTYTASAYIYRVSGFSGNTGIDIQTFTNGTCSAGQATAGRVNTTATNAWTRVTSTISTTGISSVEVRFITDGANTNSRAYADGFQLEQNSTATPYFDGSFGPGYTWDGVPNASVSRRQSGVALAYSSFNSATGIGAASRGIYPTLQLDQDGSGDIITASASGVARLQLTNTGILRTSRFEDIDDTRYFLDPGASGTSASLSGSLTLANNGEHDINYLNGSTINFQRSAGGDAGLTSTLYLAATGFVGIGTTSPGGLLTVKSNSSGTNPVIQSINDLGIISNFYTGRSGNAAISGKTVIENTSANPILLNSSGGNVGIGTTSPNYTLQVNGNFNIGPNNVALSAGSNGPVFANVSGFGLEMSTFKFGVAINNGTSPNFVIDNSGQVGVGTTGPAAALEVYNGGSGTLYTNGNLDPGGFTASTSWGTTTSDPEGLAIGWNRTAGSRETDFVNIAPGQTPGGFQFDSWNGTTYKNLVKIDNNGDLGIGTTSPATPLDIRTSSGVALTAQTTGGSGTFAGVIVNDSNCTTCHGLRIDAGTNSTTVSPTTALFIQFENSGATHQFGSISGSGGNGILVNSPSDIRIKTDIQPTNFGLSDLLKIEVANYHFIGDETGQLQTGFLAQQLYQIYPNAVRPPDKPEDWYNTFNPNDIWTVDYSRVTPLIIKSVQDLNTKVDNNYATLSAQLAHVNLTQTGNIVMQDATPSASFTIPHYYTLSDALGNSISQMGAFAELVVGNLRVGNVSAQQIFTNSLAIATDQVTIAGQSLRDYITGVVNQVLANNQNSTNSPIADIDQIHTNLVSPLASDSAIMLDLHNSRIAVKNSANGQTVASIDNAGNATFSGQLNSQNLAVNGDATISGTLHAGKIVANDIEGLTAVVGTLSAQNITNVTNIYFASPSASPTGSQIATGYSNPGSTTSGVPNGGYTQSSMPYANVASYSAYLAYVPNLEATTGMFDQGLMSLGSTSLADTTITGQLSIGSQLILADNSINVLGGTFQIQPLRQGGVSFEGGLLAIDTDGNMTVNGNAVFAKNLAANIISPLANNRDLTLQLGQNSNATGSALATSSLSVQNASGSGIFTVDQLGNLVASGEATIGKLNLSFAQPALAVSDTEVVATGSAGTTMVKAHQVEVTIRNILVTNRSLIYITPVGQSTITPYLVRQTPGVSFTVGIPVQQVNNINFNWLIVN